MNDQTPGEVLSAAELEVYKLESLLESMSEAQNDTTQFTGGQFTDVQTALKKARARVAQIKRHKTYIIWEHEERLRQTNARDEARRQANDLAHTIWMNNRPY